MNTSFLYSLAEGRNIPREFKISWIASWVIGLLAHGYLYMNFMLAHDDFQLFAGGNITSVQAGRWGAWPLSYVGGGLHVQWFLGILTIMTMSVIVYLLVELLRLKKVLSIWLVAGILITGVPTLVYHLYTTGIFYNTAAILLFVLPFYIEEKFIRVNKAARFLLASVCIALGTSIYNPFFCVSATLALILLILRFFEGEKDTALFKRAVYYLLFLVVGLLFWKMISEIFLKMGDLQWQSYYGEDKIGVYASWRELFQLCIISWKQGVKYYVSCDTVSWLPDYLVWLHRILILCSVIGGGKLIVERKLYRDKGSLCLLGVFLLLLPLAINIMGVISPRVLGQWHAMYRYALLFPYLLIIKVTEEIFVKSGKIKTVFFKVVTFINLAGMAYLVWYGAEFCNGAYLKLENNYEIAKAIGNRIIMTIESYEDYAPDKPVAFVGGLNSSYFKTIQTRGFDKYRDINIINSYSSMTWDGVIPAFLQQALGWRQDIARIVFLINSSNNELSMEDMNEIREMPCFPLKGCVREIGGVIVIHMSNDMME